MTTLAGLYRHARARLSGAGIEAAAQETRILVEGITGSRSEDLVCRPMSEVEPEKIVALEKALSRRLAGEPVHRILGWREFYGLRLGLSPETLEPRPDTETLVDAVLPFVRQRVAATGGCRILDLGTGTGAVALALLAEVAEATAVGTDIAPGALAAAGENARQNGLGDRFVTLSSSWFDAVPGKFDLIVSNPPYIRRAEIETLDREVRDHDPLAALDGGLDGLDAYRAIALNASDHLAKDGLLAVEIGFDQAESVSAVFAAQGFAVAPVLPDLAGNHRVLLANMRL